MKIRYNNYNKARLFLINSSLEQGVAECNYRMHGHLSDYLCQNLLKNEVQHNRHFCDSMSLAKTKLMYKIVYN